MYRSCIGPQTHVLEDEEEQDEEEEEEPVFLSTGLLHRKQRVCTLTILLAAHARLSWCRVLQPHLPQHKFS
jgi:hypothetical protein